MRQKMDDRGRRGRVTDAAAHAVVAYANWFQFGRGQTVRNPRVQSRMVLWCKQGRGEVEVNGQRFAIEPHAFVLMPWNHSVTYHADRREPFLVGGVHVLPYHHPGRPVRFDVAHARNSELSDVGWRRDVRLAGVPALASGRLDALPALAHLLEYVVLRFVRQAPAAEAEMRTLGRLLVAELGRSMTVAGSGEEAVPPAVRQAMQWVRDHVRRPASTADLADLVGCSPSTLQRMFRRHVGMSPLQFIGRVKVERATDLLRSTRLPVSAVAREVGMGDPFYFSRWLRRLTGKGPRETRGQGLRL